MNRLNLLLRRGLAAGAVAAAWLLTLSPALASCPPILDHRMQSIRGEPINLCQFAGRVVLVVNTASYCGFTDQYKGLEELYQRHRQRGFVVLGVPSNDFGAQEPGSNAEVAEFCERTYRVRFPMTEKAVVRGPDATPLFRQLAQQSGSVPGWNFHKYVVGRDGKVVAAFPSAVAPGDARVAAVVEAALGPR
jgi:glutathione peroxidase